MPFVSGFLRVRQGSGNRPDNSLPGGGGEIDNSLPGAESPVDPGYGIPEAPPGLFPPAFPSNPIVIAPPNTPPGVIWPSPNPPHIDHTLPTPPAGGGGRPDNTLPGQLPRPSHPIASKTYWMLCYTPNLGWKYVSVDPSLRPDQGLPAPLPPLPTPHK